MFLSARVKPSAYDFGTAVQFCPLFFTAISSDASLSNSYAGAAAASRSS